MQEALTKGGYVGAKVVEDGFVGVVPLAAVRRLRGEARRASVGSARPSVGAVSACANVAPKTVFRRVTVVQVAAGAGFALYTAER